MDLGQGDPFFVPTRPGYKYVFDVFPKLPMFFQVDLNGHFVALLVGQVLNSGHGFSVAFLYRSFHAITIERIRQQFRDLHGIAALNIASVNHVYRLAVLEERDRR